MPVCLITGAAGLVGSEAVRFYSAQGWKVIGIDNGLRSKFFGVSRVDDDLVKQCTEFHNLDIRNTDGIEKIFCRWNKAIDLIIHAAAQPSHDLSAKDPRMDFAINAGATVDLLEATRLYCPDAVFCLTSTNKVYGSCEWVWIDELETRYEVYAAGEPWKGFDEGSSVDQTLHSPFGCGKLAADVYAQEYGRYFGLKTGIFRCGCITGPAHAGAPLHGFLAYLVACVVSGTEYTIHGYKGKQVRDNIHAFDLVTALDAFYRDPKRGEVYNLGGGRERSCSILEAIAIAEKVTGKKLRYRVEEQARRGDHQHWITDVSKFRKDYPVWSYKYDLEATIREIAEAKR